MVVCTADVIWETQNVAKFVGGRATGRSCDCPSGTYERLHAERRPTRRRMADHEVPLL